MRSAALSARSGSSFDLLTYSMRTSRHGRLLPLTVLSALRTSRSRGWRRWRAPSVFGATADGLWTGCRAVKWERAGAGRARRGVSPKGTPPPLRPLSSRVSRAVRPTLSSRRKVRESQLARHRIDGRRVLLRPYCWRLPPRSGGGPDAGPYVTERRVLPRRQPGFR
jgi:hypothetical protein